MDKDAKLESLIEQFEAAMVMLERAANQQAAIQTGQALVAFGADLRAHPERALEAKLRLRTAKALEALSAGTSNDEKVRFVALAKIVFDVEWLAVESAQKQVTMAQNAMIGAASLAFAHTFMNQSGTFEWERYKRLVLSIMRDAAEREGGRAAVAQAAPAVNAAGAGAGADANMG